MLVKILSLQYEKQRRNETMGKLLLTGVDGNLGETTQMDCRRHSKEQMRWLLFRCRL